MLLKIYYIIVEILLLDWS